MVGLGRRERMNGRGAVVGILEVKIKGGKAARTLLVLIKTKMGTKLPSDGVDREPNQFKSF